MNNPRDVTVRNVVKPGDLGAIVWLHGVIYAREYGFDPSFEAYVAGPLSEFVTSKACLAAEGGRERIWIAERDERLVGCVAIVAAAPETAQLRWFLVDPSARGMGLGRRLLQDAVSFCRECGYRRIVLWTVSALVRAAHLYRSAGFHKVEERPLRQWGADVIEEKYELEL